MTLFGQSPTVSYDQMICNYYETNQILLCFLIFGLNLAGEAVRDPDAGGAADEARRLPLLGVQHQEHDAGHGQEEGLRHGLQRRGHGLQGAPPHPAGISYS